MHNRTSRCLLAALVTGLAAGAAPAWGQVINEDIKLLASDGAEFDNLGFSIAIDNGVIAVGVPGDDDSGPDFGSAYLFDVSTGALIIKLLPSDGVKDDGFGQSIAIDNGVVAVGARYDDDNGRHSGSAYLFDVSTGALIAKLLPNDGAVTDNFAWSIAIANGVVAVGAPQNDDNGSNSGSAYLFDASTGAQIRKLLPSDGVFNDRFGKSIAIANGIVAVGASDSSDRSGSAYLFNASTGAQIRKLLPNDGAADDYFGWSIAIDNGVVAVGARFDDDIDLNSGSAYLFDASSGAQIAKLLPNDGALGDVFGWSIAIDNGVVAVGAYYDDYDDGKGDRSGSAYLFDASSGAQITKLLPTDGAADDWFGYSIAIAASLVAVGARGDDDKGTNSGSAYVFDVNCPADLTGDGQGDLADFSLFYGCMSGPGQPLGLGCEPTDMDLDGDADMADFVMFQIAFGCP